MVLLIKSPFLLKWQEQSRVHILISLFFFLRIIINSAAVSFTRLPFIIKNFSPQIPFSSGKQPVAWSFNPSLLVKTKSPIRHMNTSVLISLRWWHQINWNYFCAFTVFLWLYQALWSYTKTSKLSHLESFGCGLNVALPSMAENCFQLLNCTD